MSNLLDLAVFPGNQGGPLEHVIAAKAIAFGEALRPSFKNYMLQVRKNASAMADAFVKKDFYLHSFLYKALRKLKHPTRARKLKTFLDE